MLQERTKNLVLRVSDEEIAKIHRIANAQDQEIARVVRAWIHAEYQSRFGVEKPPTPKLRKSPKTQA